MTQITTELLIAIHDKVREACLAKYNIDFDDFTIYDDGTISCRYTPSYKYPDQDFYDISIKDLQNEDFETLILERKAKELAEKLKREEKHKINLEKRVIREKEERKQQYLKLKKEFEK
jgi:hypothetical protein